MKSYFFSSAQLPFTRAHLPESALEPDVMTRYVNPKVSQ